MINITFPDGNVKQFEAPTDGFAVATSISEGFARNCVAMEIEGMLVDLSVKIDKDTNVSFLTTKDEQALEIMRHSAAHVMAQAILNLYPKAKLTIGPTVENGFYYDIDMEPISEDDFPKIEAEIKKIIKAKTPIVRREVAKQEAVEFYKDEPYKLEMIEGLDDGTISFYSQGEFTDLCRGPHVPNTGYVKAIKLMKVSGAYWRADPANPQLQRIYGTAFFDKKELNAYLNFLEEARKRDHRKIGAALDLFSFHDEAPGMAFFHPNGMEIWNALLDYWREEHRTAGYVETKTPLILNRSLWEQSGHWENYRDNMYTVVIDEVESAIKPMNCPGGMLLYKRKRYSYKDLPLRAGEVGLVHRHELSGVLSGLFRVRAFHQDDAHIFMTPDQIKDEIIGVLRLVDRMYKTFGLGFHLELSTRPKKSIGSDEQWESATNGLSSALDEYGLEYKINEGDGAFYGPKIDIHINDAIGRTWQCGTIQVDFSMPGRLGAQFVADNSERKTPVMLHRAVLGSFERFIGILIEEYEGAFPTWLAPTQVAVLNITDNQRDYCENLAKKWDSLGYRVNADLRNEKIGFKIREHTLNKVPYLVVVGDKEVENNAVAVRTRKGEDLGTLSLEAFEQLLQKEVERKGNTKTEI